jgi:uncharacterized iron-regulated membrane protein
MVFDEQLDQWLNPQLFDVAAGSYVSEDMLVSEVLSSHPGYYVSSLNLPSRSGAPAIAYLSLQPGVSGTRSWQVNIDPVSNVVLGSRDRGQPELSMRGFTHFISRFHHSLLLGDSTRRVFGFIALLWFFNHIVALCLAQPTGRSLWRNFVVGRRTSIAQWHRVTGLWLFPVTLVISLSAVYLNLGAEFRLVVAAFSPITQPFDQRQPSVPAPDFAPPISFDEARRAASGHVPEAEIDGISFLPHRGLYRVRFFDERDINPLVGYRHVFVHTHTGRIMHDSHFAEGSIADQILAWQFPLHSGKAFGWPGRLLIFLAGMIVCVSVITGVLGWLKRQRSKRPNTTRTLGNK